MEIHRPGALPNGLQVEDITNGTSMPRNNFLFGNAIYLLPYTGAGSGIIEISAVNLWKKNDWSNILKNFCNISLLHGLLDLISWAPSVGLHRGNEISIMVILFVSNVGLTRICGGIFLILHLQLINR